MLQERGNPANLSGRAPREGPQRLAGCPQLLATASGGHGANVSGGNLITQATQTAKRFDEAP